jgi:hypothetical protein
MCVLNNKNNIDLANTDKLSNQDREYERHRKPMSSTNEETLNCSQNQDATPTLALQRKQLPVYFGCTQEKMEHRDNDMILPLPL